MRVVNWNVLYRGREERTEVLVERLQRVSPDVVLLQETSPSHAADVARRLDLRVVACGSPVGGDVPVAIPAVLANRDLEPVGEEWEIAGEYRALASLRLLHLPDGTGLVVCGSVHLSHTAKAGSLAMDSDYVRLSDGRGNLRDIADPHARESIGARLTELGALELKAIEAAFELAPGQASVVLGGDFNFMPYGVEHQTIVSSGFRDAWSTAPRLGSRDTILEQNPLIHDSAYSDRPDGATGSLDYTLDFQFVTSDLQAERAWTLGRPDTADPEWISDHLGIAVDYSFDPDGRLSPLA